MIIENDNQKQPQNTLNSKFTISFMDMEESGKF